jgi:hypothetical protein
MIKTPKFNKVNVIMDDGSTYLGKDIPPHPLGDTENLVSFIEEGDLIKVIPMRFVKCIDFYWEDQNE